MNLIEQFPDVSDKIRAKRKMKQTKASKRISRPAQVYHEPKSVAGSHEAAFRRWHLKVLLIIAGSIGITYYALLNSPLVINY
jgi:hypothetical protein